MSHLTRFGPYVKAIVSALVGGAVAFLSSLATALQGEHAGFDTITDGQWVTAVLAFLVGLGISGSVTHQVRNRSVPPPPPTGSTGSATAPAAAV